MMLRALHANDVVPAAQMKKSKPIGLDFLAGMAGFTNRGFRMGLAVG